MNVPEPDAASDPGCEITPAKALGGVRDPG
jgi:hypothetical protein